MVPQGQRRNNHRGGSSSIQAEYLIQIQEIKPWPPSQSLRSLRSVLIQWENGDRNAGSTKPVSPSLGSGTGDGKIKFNETFRIPVTLCREIGVKGGYGETFEKNCLEFNLYEPRRDKTVRGQLLGTAVVDLAEYGLLTDKVVVSSPMNCKRSFRNSIQPHLFVKIQPLDIHSASSSSSMESLSKDESISNKSSNELVSALITGENAEESEIMSFTYDDVSSHSSLILSSSALSTSPAALPTQSEENVSEGVGKIAANSVPVAERSGTGNLVANSVLKLEAAKPEVKHLTEAFNRLDAYKPGEDTKAWAKCRSWQEEVGSISGRHAGLRKEKYEDDGQEEVNPGDAEVKGNMLISNRQKPVMSFQSPHDSCRRRGSLSENQFMEVVKEIDISEDGQNSPKSFKGSERKNSGVVQREGRDSISDTKLRHLEHRIQKLEGELREAAAVEVSLYAVAAEHGSSANKVHAPARRLFRLYTRACKQKLKERKATAAKSAVSGLALVAKACGSDIPRLTFWLSNSVFLRNIVVQFVEDSQQPSASSSMCVENNGGGKGRGKSFPTNSRESSPVNKDKMFLSTKKFDDWENSQTFVNALEKIEAWIFSRIIESLWWQIFTPFMQSAPKKPTKEHNKVSYEMMPSRGDEQVNYSLDLWRNAFKDAYERLCPVRAGGHECGCLHVLPRLVMEQCVGRLDMAMFNAILRESADDSPTDPISDPISDSRVLPVPAGNSSFGLGAQLKNAIGNWSRCLTDLLGKDDKEVQNEIDGCECESLFKSFHLLGALSDLMMLPKDMLLDGSVRKEVCPTFGAALIKKILQNFVPDEFCPDSVPEIVFEALDSKGLTDDVEGSIESIPANTIPITYFPPTPVSLADIVKAQNDSKLKRCGSFILRKSHTSDDELEELDSPLNSIIPNNLQSSVTSNWKPKKNEGQNPIRYQLLREVWKDGNSI
ncbi:uncharacterized protein LOC113281487 [Papaver somniferum]|uniref:uncharacterized protein LOC113281487 n=1 Tax=Papaver somniferum TaxID=3469 RepID=UPI000E6F8706|nr:uncharacterized protein LOC113281487 [Papaver somniferum]XP_026386037.1 uncharacterized protein LOC113281487 [Papaver somniferum]